MPIYDPFGNLLTGLAPIDRVTLATPGLISFPSPASGLTVLPTAYTSLLVAGIVRSARVANWDFLGVRFGTGGGAVDAGANYSNGEIQASNATITANPSIAGTSALCGIIDAASAVANGFTAVTVFIPNYQSGALKEVQSTPALNLGLGTLATTIFAMTAGAWRNAGPISLMTFGGANAGDNLVANSSLALYGMN